MIVFTPLLNIFFINLISSWWRGLYKLKKFETSRVFFFFFFSYCNTIFIRNNRLCIPFFIFIFAFSISLFMNFLEFIGRKRRTEFTFFKKTKRKRKKIKNILGIRSHPPTSNFSENYDFSRNWNYIFKIYLLFDIYNVFLLGNERIEFMAKERKIQKVFQFLVSY